jgi:hypothetical protein
MIIIFCYKRVEIQDMQVKQELIHKPLSKLYSCIKTILVNLLSSIHSLCHLHLHLLQTSLSANLRLRGKRERGARQDNDVTTQYGQNWVLRVLNHHTNYLFTLQNHTNKSVVCYSHHHLHGSIMQATMNWMQYCQHSAEKWGTQAQQWSIHLLQRCNSGMCESESSLSGPIQGLLVVHLLWE